MRRDRGESQRIEGMTVTSPEPGRIALVRQRRYLVENVTPPPSPNDATLVDLSCLDDDAQGEPLSVLWEHELDARVLEDDGWSAVAEKGFDDPALFAAYLRTLSWNCVTATDPNLFQAPFRAGIRIDAYQLDPLRKALRLPRVNLFIADDVGLGKTIEAGLIVRELLLRRRIDRIVVACPPAMLDQWQDELEARFGLTFAILDRTYVTRMRRERGFSVNPWTTHSRFLISHRLLVDEAYASGLRDWLGEFAPQTLLILDEAHNAAQRAALVTRSIRRSRAPSATSRHVSSIACSFRRPHITGIRTAFPPCSKSSTRNASVVGFPCSRGSSTKCWSGGSNPISESSKAGFHSAPWSRSKSTGCHRTHPSSCCRGCWMSTG